MRRRNSNANVVVAAGAIAAGVGLWLWWRRREHAADAGAHAPGAPGGPPGGAQLDPVGPPPRDDVEALARVLASEAAAGGKRGYSDAERRAIAWAVRNRARKRKVSIVQLVCAPQCGPCCHGRPFSSRQLGSAADLALAREVLSAPASADPTGGALAFFEPAEQDRFVAEGRPGYHSTATELRTKWIHEGQKPHGSVGAFEFWA